MAKAETFQVKVEGLPRRCEICHQDDRFDPFSGHCGRCSEIVPIHLGNVAVTSATGREGLHWADVVSFSGAGLLGLLGLPTLIQLFLFASNSIRTVEHLLFAGVVAFAGFGYFLCYCYFLILRGAMRAAENVWVGKATLLYNLVIFLGLVWLFFRVAPMNLLVWGMVALWFGWIVFMMGYGGFLIVRNSGSHATSTE